MRLNQLVQISGGEADHSVVIQAKHKMINSSCALHIKYFELGSTKDEREKSLVNKMYLGIEVRVCSQEKESVKKDPVNSCTGEASLAQRVLFCL